MTDFFKRIVDSSAFQLFILGIILLAAIVVGLETSEQLSQKYAKVFSVTHRVILWIFVAEAVIKMAQHGRHFLRYFRDPWNVFDFLVVVICFLPMGKYVAIFRLARVVRALRLVTALPRLQLIVNCLLKSIPSMFYVGVLLSLTFYVYAVVGVFLFRDNDPVHFRDLPHSLLTMFRVVTLEDWTDVMYIQMYGSDVYQYSNPENLPTSPKSQLFVGAAFFVSFVLFGTMIILNLFIGVILNSMAEAEEENERNQISADKASGEQQSVTSEFHAIENQLNELQQNLTKLRLRVRSETES